MKNFKKLLLVILFAPLLLSSKEPANVVIDSNLLSENKIHYSSQKVQKQVIQLTKSEKLYLKNQKPIRYVYDLNREPFEYKNDLGIHSGVTADIINLISKKSSLKFQAIQTNSWKESIKLMKDKKADMFSFVIENEKRKKYLDFTKRVLFKVPVVFVTDIDDDRIYENVKFDLKGKKIGIVKGRAIQKVLLKKYPDFNFVELNSVDEGFESIKNAKIDMLAINKSTAKYYIKIKGYDETKIATSIDTFFKFKIALQKQLPPEVYSIISKSLQEISDKDINQIYNKNINIKVTKHTDWGMLLKVSSFAILIFLFLLWSNKKLKTLVEKKTREMSRLLNKFDENVIASKTDINGKITYVSQAFCDICEYSKEELLGNAHGIIRDPEMQNEIFNDLWKTIENGDVWHGKVKNIKKNGGFYWVDVIIFPEFDKDGNIIEYSAIRHEITAQKEVEDLTINLEMKIKERTKELKNEKLKIEIIHKHIRDSIKYAALTQGALIPDNKVFRKYFQDYFAIWHPKDTVGGDIYLFEELRHDDECLIMVIDCTGHGVPGAFVTMLVKAIERQIVTEINNDKEAIVSPAKILGIFNQNMKQLLKQECEESISNVGFDGGIIYYNKKDKILKFAGAETPLFYVKDDKLKMIKGDRYSVGYKKCSFDYEYKEHIIEVKDGMQFYLTTDGYLDQNGGEKGFCFGKKRFQKLIQEYHMETLADQQEVFLNELSEYQDDYETNDDVTLISFKI